MKEQKVFPFRARLEKRGVASMPSERAGWLTRYEVENLVSDAMWAGHGAKLEVSVPARTSEDGLGWIRNRFEGLRGRGIGVRVHRDETWEFRDIENRRRA